MYLNTTMLGHMRRVVVLMNRARVADRGVDADRRSVYADTNDAAALLVKQLVMESDGYTGDAYARMAIKALDDAEKIVERMEG